MASALGAPSPRRRFFFPRRHLDWKRLAKYAAIGVVLTLATTQFILFRHGSDSSWYHKSLPDYWSLPSPLDANPNATVHPIETLMYEARARHNRILSERSTDVETAAARYRERRGRHPPPGFDHWFKAAMAEDAIVVESFFDRIYHDLNPFWAVDSKTTAQRARDWYHVVRVRNGKAEGVGDTEGRVDWLRLWTEVVAEAAAWLPDVDMPINYMDESRVLVPGEEISKLVAKEKAGRKMLDPEKILTKYTGLEEFDSSGSDHAAYDPAWIKADSRKYWDFARAACPTDSPSHNVPALEDFARPPSMPHDWKPDYAFEGFVRNFTASMDPCIQPHLRGLHGTFIEPISMATSTELIPLFGGCKLPVNNEILIPGAMYLTADPFYSGGETHGPDWRLKKDGMVWRGVASGGRNKRENWTHFHRHRLVEMLNGTTVSAMERNDVRAMTFDMPPPLPPIKGDKSDDGRYSRLRDQKLLGPWLSDFADAGFVHLLCFPSDSGCEYIAEHFSEVKSMPMREQYEHKFLPDADGNSFSARFRGFVLSTSLPLKATIYAEWHDDRLMPWMHFVPLDNTFRDLYAVLEFFAAPAEVNNTHSGGPGVGGSKMTSTGTSAAQQMRGDAAARWIAEEGKRWGEMVLRRADMKLYVWRLLLEWARVCDVERDRLGFVADLLEGGKLRSDGAAGKSGGSR